MGSSQWLTRVADLNSNSLLTLNKPIFVRKRTSRLFVLGQQSIQCLSQIRLESLDLREDSKWVRKKLIKAIFQHVSDTLEMCVSFPSGLSFLRIYLKELIR